jgi:hypothetical protein
MIDRDAALSQQLFDVFVRQAIPQVPPDRQDDHIRRKPESCETGPGWWHLNPTKAHQPTLPEPPSINATDPFAVYDVMRLGAGEIDYPVPWASDPGTSFVAERDTYRQLLEQAGFRIEHERDRRQFGIESFARLRASWSEGHRRWARIS